MSEPNPTYEKIAGSRFLECDRTPTGQWYVPERYAPKYENWRVICFLGKPATEEEPESVWAWVCPRQGSEDLNVHQG